MWLHGGIPGSLELHDLTRNFILLSRIMALALLLHSSQAMSDSAFMDLAGVLGSLGLGCHNVLCWVDSTSDADHVVQIARCLSGRGRSRCQVVKCLDAACTEPGGRPSPLTPEKIEQTEGHLAALYGREVATMVLPGNPVSEVRRYAKNHGVDLIVMGEQGLALESKYGERLIEDPPCAVMVLVLPKSDRKTPRAASKQER